MKSDFDCAVIGAGVAGMTAALYLKRAGIDVCLFEKEFVGGQINKTYTIKNYPGLVDIDGPSLAFTMSSQLKELEIPIIFEKVENITDLEHSKLVKTNKTEYRVKAVIIATGKKERSLGLDNEKELIGHGISWCATCDGNLFKEKVVAVVGGGNTAMENALYLSNICDKVYIINRSDNFRTDKILLEQVKTKENIVIIVNSVIKTLISENGVLAGIQLHDNSKIRVSGLFVAIGSDPVVDFAKNLDIEMSNNYIVVDEGMQTSVEGIFACGDVIEKDLYQIITAASDGAKSANSVKNFLNR
ncbi:MAG: FAD-dependent oxidoreductase [Firmicutes bacterium]|nr:FAD-dependent oxidoreductase [Bacillota bacterium]